MGMMGSQGMGATGAQGGGLLAESLMEFEARLGVVPHGVGQNQECKEKGVRWGSGTWARELTLSRKMLTCLTWNSETSESSTLETGFLRQENKTHFVYPFIKLTHNVYTRARGLLFSFLALACRGEPAGEGLVCSTGPSCGQSPPLRAFL